MTVLTEAITAGVTTGHVADHIQLHDYFNGIGDTFNITDADYGASPGATAAANTTAINLAFTDASAAGTAEAPSVLVIPAGQDFAVTNNGVTGASNVIVTGGGTLSTTVAATVGAPGHLITFPTGATGWGVVGVRFKGPDNSIVAIKATSARDFVVKDCTVINATLIRTNADIATYATIDTDPTTGNTCRDFTIANCVLVNAGGAADATNLAGILLLYASHGVITGNRITRHHQGIQWWGGNAGTAEGDRGNERKCSHLTITGNVVTDSAEGGIWGSMGELITVAGNVVDGAGDICIDFEGCVTCTASGNTVTGGANAGLTTFFICDDVTFSGNVVTTDVLNGGICRLQNGSGLPTPRGVRFVNNIFSCTNGVGLALMETSENFEFSNNLCRNVSIHSAINNQKYSTIESNTFLFTVVRSAAFNAIDAGANNAFGRLRIRNNTVTSSVAQPAGSKGITQSQIDSSQPPVVIIEGNEVNDGFPISIETVWAGPTAAANHVLIRNNTIPVGKPIVIDNTGAALPSVVVKTGNRYEDLTSAD